MSPELLATLEKLNNRIDQNIKNELDAVFALELDGESCTFDVRQNGVGLLMGAPETHGLAPRVTLSASAHNFMALLRGELNPMMAAMGGKIKLGGDVGFAMKLSKLF